MAKCILLVPGNELHGGAWEVLLGPSPGGGGGYRKKDEAEGEVNEDEAAAKVSVDPCEAVHLEEPSLP